MISRIIFSVLFSSFLVNRLNAQVIQWLTQGGGSENDYSASITIDPQGNLYTIGTFTGTAVFGSHTLSAIGKGDVFVTRADAATGAINWAKKIGSVAEDRGNAIATDQNGNIYCTGRFSGTITAGTSTYSAAGLSEAFVAKLDPANGTITWFKKMGGSGSDNGSAVATDASGNVYTTGYFQGTATFGTYTLLPAGNNFNAFVTKTDASGSFLWATSLGGSGYTFGNSITGSNGKIYVTGSMESTAMFGTVTLTSKGNTDVFIAELDAGSGTPTDAKNYGGTGNDAGTAIISKPNGSVYTTGKFESTVIFGTDTLMSAGSSDSFVLEQNAAGAPVWACRVGGTGYDQANAISYDAAGNIYITGQFGGVLPLSGNTFYANGIADVFIARVDPFTGSVSAGMQSGGAGVDIGTALARNAAGEIYVSGSFQTTANFENATVTSAGNADVFTLKLNAGVVGLRKTIMSQHEFRIYPNPFQNELHIISENQQINEYTICITDALGRILLQKKETTSDGVIDLKSLKAGMYYILISTGDRNPVVKKLIKN